MKTSFRTTASVIAVTIAALAAPTLAHAKRMGGGKSVRPAAIGQAPAK
ncbi:ABC transporter substrate-binding protein, partial [Comamonas aquatica]|nr:ABC transporter substrate-binding protein [Comamonas aquatica]